MTVKTHGVGIFGIDGVLVEVEVGRQDGLPGMDIVGLPATTVKEARHRVRSALRAGGYEWPPERLVVNFAPADLPKQGTGLDLPLAVAVLVLFGVVQAHEVADCAFFAELTLDGALRPVPGAVSAALTVREAGIRRLVVAPDVACEAAAVPGVEILAPASVAELVELLQGRAMPAVITPVCSVSESSSIIDLHQIRGQAHAKRAIEIAAAGRHNVLFIGPPGCGKTLLARALPGILPPLDLDESLEVTRIHSVAGLNGRGRGLIGVPPFRAPHPTASEAALVGGGSPPRPGEVSLAHRGVLFLDEAAEFRRGSLDALRAPIEDRTVTIARSSRSVTFPSSVMVVLATNPCPCGHWGDGRRACRCTPAQVRAYQQRLSGPLLDRVDLYVELAPVSAGVLAGADRGTSSAHVQARVMAARARQWERHASVGPAIANADLDLTGLARFAVLGQEEAQFLAHAAESIGISARAWHRVVRIARTIADLVGEPDIGVPHLIEALTFRRWTAAGAQVAPRVAHR